MGESATHGLRAQIARLSRGDLMQLVVLLPIASGALAAVGGFALGVLVMWSAMPSPLEVAREASMTLDQIEFGYATIIAEQATELDLARGRVSQLEAEAVATEARVAELETTLSTRGQVGLGGVAALTEARERLARLEDELALARGEVSMLQSALTQTVAQLERVERDLGAAQAALSEQMDQTRAAREEALVQRWNRFLGESQLSICERGNRKKLGACREDVTAALSVRDVKRGFVQCVRSGQATPSVNELEKGAELPRHAYDLGPSKVLVGWYVLLCDPTLPERTGTADDYRD